MVGPLASAQRVLVRHAGGSINLPLLPTDNVQSLRCQLQLFGLRPCGLPSFAHCVQLREGQTMAEADVLDCSRTVFMARDPPAAAGVAAALRGAAGGAGDDWSLWVYPRQPITITVSAALWTVSTPVPLVRRGHDGSCLPVFAAFSCAA